VTTRYVTDGEKEGVKRRVNAHADRQRELGRLARKTWATDAEADRLRAILAAWRGKMQGLDTQAAVAAMKLFPGEVKTFEINGRVVTAFFDVVDLRASGGQVSIGVVLDIAGQMFSMQLANDRFTLRDEPEETVSGKLMALATALGGSTELLPGFIELQAYAQEILRGILEMPCAEPEHPD
jgi:hypothetical protein